MGKFITYYLGSCMSISGLPYVVETGPCRWISKNVNRWLQQSSRSARAVDVQGNREVDPVV